MQRSLNYQAMPPIGAPLPFLLCAPLFVLAAALLLAWHGEAALTSRWTPLTLAMTHLLTLGSLTMTIVGALFQLLPVVAGVGVAAVRPVAAFCWLALALGTVLLASALGWGLGPAAFQVAAAVLGAAGLAILGAVGAAISHRAAPAARDLVQGVRLASSGLAITIGLGAMLALYLAGMGPLNAPLLTNVHASWGLIGWVVALTSTVSFQVIPMFQGTAAYPRMLESGMPAVLFALLLAWSAATLGSFAHWAAVAEIGLGALLLHYAWTTLKQFHARKRKADVGTWYWMLAMGSLALTVLVHFLPLEADRRALLTGVLVIAGFAISAINGMLYKIVPFLVWYHLQAATDPARGRAPGIASILPPERALRQWRWHLVGLALLAAAPLAPGVLARPAGLCQALAAALLVRDLGGAALLYLRLRAR